MLFIETAMQEILIVTERVIFLLQYLGFTINFKRILLTLLQKIEFLALLIDSVEFTLSLTPKNLEKNQSNLMMQRCARHLNGIGVLSSTAKAVFSAKLQVYYIQQATDSVYSKNTIMLSPISLNSGFESGALIRAAKNIEC